MHPSVLSEITIQHITLSIPNMAITNSQICNT